jgi:crotonobetainyl-CoA:carnitine CoA-transferase CaiB-like acyl-CoA transferase
VCIWVRADQWVGACNAIGRPDLAHDPRFATSPERQKNWRTALAIFQDHAAGLTADAFLADWHGQRLIGAKAARATELFESDAHLQARGFWESVDTSAGERPVLGPQFRMGETPRRLRGDAPRYQAIGAA